MLPLFASPALLALLVVAPAGLPRTSYRQPLGAGCAGAGCASALLMSSADQDSERAAPGAQDEPASGIAAKEPTSGVEQFAARVSEVVSEQREHAAFVLRVTPAWVDVFFGCWLWLLLIAAGESGLRELFPSPATGLTLGRVLAVAAFAGVQTAAGLPLPLWLRLGEDSEAVDSNPLFQSGSPLAGVTFAFMLAVPGALVLQAGGIDWLPSPREFPAADTAALSLFVAPASEEIFFRAWLLRAVERAGWSQGAAAVASTFAFALFKVPLNQILRGSLELQLYETLGLYLAFLYQRSGGSLPFVVVCHCTCNLIVTALSAAQVGSVLPF